MNCLGEMLCEYFKKIPVIYNNFNIKMISTYLDLNDKSIICQIKDADYLITNNVKQYEIFTPSNLKLYVKEECKIIVIEFLRFNGFYPLQHITSPKNNLTIYDESYKKSNSFEEFINYKVDENVIIKNFNESLKKLKILDEQSDIKFYDFFIENYKKIPLFRDSNHPSDIYVRHIMINLLKKMEIDVDVDYINNIKIPYTSGFKFRYRPILNCVKYVLELNYDDDDDINMYNKNISKRDFYNIINKSLTLTDIEIEKEFNNCCNKL